MLEADVDVHPYPMHGDVDDDAKLRLGVCDVEKKEVTVKVGAVAYSVTVTIDTLQAVHSCQCCL